MNYFWKINIYETQALLYWILGFLILHFGDWKWIGWVAIVWGWFTFIYLTLFTAKNADKIRDLWKD